MNLSSGNNFPSSVPPHLLESKCRDDSTQLNLGQCIGEQSNRLRYESLLFSLCPLLCVPGSLNILRSVTGKRGPGLVWNWRKTIVAYWHSIVYPSCSYFALLISLVHLVKHNFFIKLIWQSPIHLWRNLLSVLGVYIFNWKRSATATIRK